MDQARQVAQLALLLAVASAAACGGRNLVRTRIFDRAETQDSFVVAEGPTTLYALDRALEEGRDYCLAQGKEFKRLDKWESYQGRDRTSQAVQSLIGETIGPRFKQVVERQDYRVEILFRCVDPNGEPSSGLRPGPAPAVPLQPKLAPEPAVPPGTASH